MEQETASLVPSAATAPRVLPQRCPWSLRVRLCIGYAFYHLSKGVFLIAAIPLLLLLFPFPRTRQRVLGGITHAYLGWLSRSGLPAIGIYHLAEVSGLDRAGAARPAVYVSNHRSRMDGPFLLGLLPNTGVVIKAREGHQWSFALLMRHFDFVSVSAGNLARLRGALDRAREILSEGRSLVIFPEGTRAPSGRLQSFHPLAFQLARDAGVPIVPVVVHSTLPFMGRIAGSYFPVAPNVFRVRFLEIDRPGPNEDPDEWSDRIRRRMARELRELDAGTYWETAPRQRHE